MSLQRPRRSRQSTHRIALTLFMGLALTACGSPGTETTAAVERSWDGVVAAAEEEGAVTFYTTQVPDRAEDLVEKFEAEYPQIEVNLVSAEDTELIPRVEAEDRTGNGVADVYVTASEPWITENTDVIVPPGDGPAFMSEEYDRSANVTESGYFTVTAYVGAFGWNTELHSGEIRDWADLLNPSLAGGRIGVVNPDTATKVGFYTYLTENYGESFVEELAALEPQIYDRAPAMAAAVTSGEIAAGTFVQPLVEQQEEGAPVDWGLGDRPWGVAFYGLILRSAPNPNAAQVFADFLVTRAGQEAFARGGAAVLPDIPGSVTSISEMELLDVGQFTTEVQQDFGAEWEQLFQR